MNLSVFAAAAEAGNAAALVSQVETVTYAALARGTAAALEHLARHGITRTTPAPFALVGEARRETIELLLGAFAIGAPVLILHPRAPEGSRAELLARLRLPLLGPPATAGARASDRAAAPPRPPRAPPLLDDDRPLVVVTTSGSSGPPAAVVLSRRAIVASARASAQNLPWQPEDRWLLALPLAHVGGLSVLTRCLLARRAVVLAARTDPATLVATLARHRVTLLSLVPTQLVRLLAAGFAPPPCVRAVLLGGAPTAPGLLTAAAARGWPVLTTYGLTEAASQVTTESLASPAPAVRGAGRPLPGVELAVRAGRVAVRGPTLASGLLAGPAAANGVLGPLLPLPMDGEGWLITGDLGRIEPDGTLHVLGRADRMLNSGGENVSPERIEAELVTVPEIREAAVVGAPDAVWGQRIVACVVWHDTPLELAELQTRLAPRCAPQELPRAVVSLPELPRLATGKLDHRRLATLVATAQA